MSEKDENVEIPEVVDDPTAEERKRAILIVLDLFGSAIPPHVRNYLIMALIAFLVTSVSSVADDLYSVLGVATSTSLEEVDTKIDFLIEKFQEAHPEVAVDVDKLDDRGQ